MKQKHIVDIIYSKTRINKNIIRITIGAFNDYSLYQLSLDRSIKWGKSLTLKVEVLPKSKNASFREQDKVILPMPQARLKRLLQERYYEEYHRCFPSNTFDE